MQFQLKQNNLPFQIKQHMIWADEIRQTASYGTIVQILRAARYLLMYRHATKLSMELIFVGKKPDHETYQKEVRLFDLLQPIDFIPDSFDTPATRQVRRLVPQKN